MSKRKKKISKLIIFDNDKNKNENDEKHDEAYKFKLDDLQIINHELTRASTISKRKEKIIKSIFKQ